jgi:XTP/dITP diphosphohydrolase
VAPARGGLVLLLATHNPKKRAEMERILDGALGDSGVHLLGLDLHPEVPAAPEEGATFAANARQKSIWYARRTGLACIADDSGLEVDALGGAPGVHSARYAASGGGNAGGKSGEKANSSDEANRGKLLKELARLGPAARTARFRCAICLADEEGSVLFEADGVTEGTILEAERGAGGFGYDPLFLSAELGQTFAQADAAAKDRVSHRGRALARLAAFLRDAPLQSAAEP